ncbi:MAG: hypothetical protein IJR15_04230 [Clostridiales bacterium]|nr:hypothetical protein [Clostridiales bacterium]
MAIKQGMCKNCGSLIVFDERDDQCECVFCHCIFPSEEAVEIYNNPEGRQFPNEKYEPSTSAQKHNVTRVYSSESLEKSIAREELRKANSEGPKTNEFEVQAKDVKAPKKLVIGVIAGAVAIVGIVIAICYPMYKTRIALRDSIEADIAPVFEGIADVALTSDAEGNYFDGFSVFGQTCQYLNAATEDELSEEDARAIFENYCALRAEKIADGSADTFDGVQIKIYSRGGYYTVTGANGEVNAVFTEDAEAEG